MHFKSVVNITLSVNLTCTTAACYEFVYVLTESWSGYKHGWQERNLHTDTKRKPVIWAVLQGSLNTSSVYVDFLYNITCVHLCDTFSPCVWLYLGSVIKCWSVVFEKLRSVWMVILETASDDAIWCWLVLMHIPFPAVWTVHRVTFEFSRNAWLNLKSLYQLTSLNYRGTDVCFSFLYFFSGCVC